MTEFPQLDSGLNVLVFTQGDDPIACLNKEMAFLSAVATSRFPLTNNQLRTSSNLRNQATIQDGKVIVQQVQGRQGQSYAGTGYKGNVTSSRGNNVGGQVRVVKCYNCQGEGHIARQCTHPKRPRNAAWFKDKAMLAEAHESGQILDEEQLAFFADLGIPDGQAAQTIILNNATFQTEDLDAYDTDYDDVSTTQAVLMANLSNYGSDVISERLNIDLSTREKMIDSQMDDMIKEKLALKQQIDSLEQNLSNQIKEKEYLLKTFTVFKNESKEKETLGYQNPFYLKKARRIKPTLYDGSVISSQHAVISVIDDEETLILEEAPKELPKLLKKQNAYNALLKSYSQLEKHCISLELSMQLNQEIFQKDKSCDNQNALKIPEYFENNDLKAQLQAKDTTISKLKEHIRSMRENDKEEKVKQEMDENETINIELEHSVAKLLFENELLHKEIEHLKNIYKDQFDSIKKTRTLSKEHCDSLIAQLNSKSMENAYLKGQIQENVFVTLKGKNVLDNATTLTNATTIALGMFKLDLDPLAPRLKSSTSASRSQPTGNKKNDRISQTPSSNMKNKVEVQLRRANLSSNKKNHVKDPICDANVKHAMLNANFELICVNCKQCMFDENHDVCFLDFVNNVNVPSKSKSAKQSKQHNIQKPTDVPSSSSLVNDRLSRLFSGSGLQFMTPGTSNSGLVPNPILQQPFNPPTKNDWDRLFQPIDVDIAGLPVSTSIDQDVPSTSIPSTQEQEQSPIISQGLEESPKTPHFHDDPLHETLHEDSTSQGSSFNVRPSYTPFELLGKWTKNHPIANVIGDPSRSVSTRNQLQTDVMWCYFDAFLTSVEPKTYKEAMLEPSWIDSMQEEIHEFERLQCITRSSTEELFTPFKDPEREFRSSRKLLKTLSLDKSRSPKFNLFSDLEEYSEEEVAETMAETMEQYMRKTRADYGSGIAKPKIADKDSYELKGQFLKELHDNTFSESDHEDANEHIEKVLEIVDLFHIPNITQDQVMLRAFLMSLTGPRCRRTRSTKTSDGLAAIQAQLNNLGREIKKVNEKVYAAQVGCEQWGYRAAALGFYQWSNANPSYQERRQSMGETLSKFMSESAKRHEENFNMIKEIRASTDAAVRNKGASIKSLEIQIGQISKDYYCEEKKGSYGSQFLEAYSYGASHINNSIPRKEKDPGSFTLPYYINNVCVYNALVDLGASVSVMPLSTYLNLGLGELAHTKLTVELVHRTVKYPKGIAENVLVGICKLVFLVDFIILDMPKDVKVPLILERPFLSTAHAKINVFKRKITLRVGDEKIIFKSIKHASSLIKRVYMLSLRERMELDLEASLMGDTLVLNRSLDPLYGDYIELNDLNVPLELRRDQVDDLMPTIKDGEWCKIWMATKIKTWKILFLENHYVKLHVWKQEGLMD
ncbi:DNA-directed DNA polymerase [Tanacetum coccineum]